MNLDATMTAIANGNVEALQLIYEEYRHIVYSVALSILRHTASAEDVLQDTFIRVYEKASSYQPGTNLKAWVITIARNLAFDTIRKSNRISEEDPCIQSPTMDTAIVQRLELTEALFRLRELERQIIVMHVVAGLKHAEISKILGIPAGTVRWKYRQSLSRLAEMIGGEYDGSAAYHFQTPR
ncbi:RNA polymerase sigma factor [Paenibacillus guangzhouensis]|uniref:RNA polymerase sigma factor n=1 Tax=Paenibacillus guangzhouensis TaxID=1473112 RepID=UPI001266C49F|nr:RNA polymerase sigma factor [Paenibacillus guangzhouensis]